MPRKDPGCEVEAVLLRRMKHENIVRVHEVYTQGSIVDILLELCTGSMRMYIRSLFSNNKGGAVYHAPPAWEIASSLQQVLKAVPCR